MKIRSGFVSNSSSTSFVYLFPDNFTADSIDWSKHHDMFKQVDVDEDGQKVVIEVGVKSAKKVINTLLATGSLWDEEVRETTDTYDDMILLFTKYWQNTKSLRLMGHPIPAKWS